MKDNKKIYTGIVLLIIFIVSFLGGDDFLAGDKISIPKPLENEEVEVLDILSEVELTEVQKNTVIESTKGLHKVSFVNDGDTIIVNISGERVSVRLLGIDTPEVQTKYTKSECFGIESSKNTFTILFDKKISLELDKSQGYFDKYDRLLAYVYLDGKNINEQFVLDGFAREYTYQNNFYKYRDDFLASENIAKENKVGLWNPEICHE